MEVNRSKFASLADTQQMWIANSLREFRKGKQIYIYKRGANNQKKKLDKLIELEKLKVDVTIIYRDEITLSHIIDYWIYVRCFR